MNITQKSEFTGNESAAQIFASVLKQRGLGSKEQATAFLKPERPTLDKLIESIGIDRSTLGHAKKMIDDALAQDKNICVFGDYDADGVTSTAILWQTLQELAVGTEAHVMPFIPDRARHGYGLSDKAIDDIFDGTAFKDTAIPDFKPDLVITVDNGIVANTQIARLSALGVHVIVTDHHQPGNELPPCNALVHSINTSGAGIAWLTSLYLSREKESVYKRVDLATIGIVADQIPLTGINRDIVVAGLAELTRTENKGVQSLKKMAGIEGRQVTTYDINYIIAPRINAVGRLDNPLEALRLLCSKDPDIVKGIAETVEKHNSNRQILTEQAIKRALESLVEHSIIVVADKDFHEGIIGLVASKLVEAHSRPAIVISINGEMSKGSARSLGGINITTIMRECSKYLDSVGGHELAGGCSLRTENIDAFTRAIYTYADRHIKQEMLVKSFSVEGELSLKQITKELAHLILHLEPFGMGNGKPYFVSRDLTVLEDRVIGKNGNHRKLVIEQDGVTRDVIWFNGTAKHPIKKISSIIYTVEINKWRDRETVQLNAIYVEPI